MFNVVPVVNGVFEFRAETIRKRKSFGISLGISSGFVALCLQAMTLSSANAESSIGAKVYPNRYIVTFSQFKTSALQQGDIIDNSPARVLRQLGSDNDAIVVPRFEKASLLSEGETVPFNPADSFCIKLLKSHQVKSCSPDFQVKSLVTPNDSQFSSLWNMVDGVGINAEQGWEVATDSTNLVIATIDTGADYNHPDLAQNIWTNPGEIPGNGIDDDNNGYIDDVHGINAATHRGDPMDDNKHGTHVAGIIGARGDNGIGVVGVNWRAKIMPLKFLGADGSGSVSDAIEAINYMVTMKRRGINIRVSNNSWGGEGYSEPLAAAIKRAGDVGIIFVAAAGNETNDNDANPTYPAAYAFPNVVSVASTDKDGNLSSFSNYGQNSVQIAAPGSAILSTTPNNSYELLSGTSMAAPHVTGALALLISQDLNLTAADAIYRLQLSGSTLPTLDGVVSSGRTLNLSQLLHNQFTTIPPKDSDSTCHYSAAAIPFAPNTAADDLAATPLGDEYNFLKIGLPFDFPFYKRTSDFVSLSPNGVMYFGRTPTSFDFQNESSAPRAALAALQTDLVSDSQPLGVRAIDLGDRMVFTWVARYFDTKVTGQVKIWVTLFKDGTIEQFVSFSDRSLESAIQSSATIGINGKSSSTAYTYAFNNSRIKNNLALRYTRSCDGEAGSAKVSKLQVAGRDSHGKALKTVNTGAKLRFALRGAGSGSVPLIVSFDKYKCEAPVNFQMQNGSANGNGTVPRIPVKFRSMQFTAGDVSTRIAVKQSTSRTTRAYRSLRQISATALNQYCESFAKSLSR